MISTAVRSNKDLLKRPLQNFESSPLHLERSLATIPHQLKHMHHVVFTFREEGILDTAVGSRRYGEEASDREL